MAAALTANDNKIIRLAVTKLQDSVQRQLDKCTKEQDDTGIKLYNERLKEIIDLKGKL